MRLTDGENMKAFEHCLLVSLFFLGCFMIYGAACNEPLFALRGVVAVFGIFSVSFPLAILAINIFSKREGI